MDHIKKLDVYIQNTKIGTLAMYKKYLAAFQYSDAWITDGYALDPIHLPLENKVFIPNYEPFQGLFGAFNDSLPDGWGRLLIDRMLKKHHMSIDEMNPLDLLSIIGNSGKGALEYKPVNNLTDDSHKSNLDKLAKQALKIFDTNSTETIDEVFNIGVSSGGARPKALVKIDNEDWIVKFPCSLDPKEIAQMEFDYCNCAKKCGIEIPEIRLLPSKNFGQFFSTKRFDRTNTLKIHMISLSTLLNINYRIPALDYNTILKLTWNLTKDINDVKEMFKRMCFNVFAHNRDDHSNNFNFLYIDNKWKPSPAYDLTYSNSLNGEHATTINGEGKNPTLEDIVSVAKNCSLNIKWAKENALEIEQIVHEELINYLK